MSKHKAQKTDSLLCLIFASMHWEWKIHILWDFRLQRMKRVLSKEDIFFFKINFGFPMNVARFTTRVNHVYQEMRDEPANFTAGCNVDVRRVVYPIGIQSFVTAASFWKGKYEIILSI